MVLHSMIRDESHTTSTTDFEDKPIERQREQRVGAANWIAAKTIAWGAITLGQGFNSWVSLSILRSFLGTFKAVRIGHSISANIHL
jgi:hypothetical protein